MKKAILTAAALVAGLLLNAFAQEEISPRTIDVPLDGAFIPVNLNRLANDIQPVHFPVDQAQLRSIPFDLVKKGPANCLFLKPIGWSAAKNEDAEYPGYIAKYDQWAFVTNDPARAAVQVPVDDYAAIWLLAATDNDTNLSDVVTFRFGVADGQARATYNDFSARVPRANATAILPGVVKTIVTPAGNLYLMRIPLGEAFAQDFKERRALMLDITKELRVAINLPDPSRFQLRPLGAASGVRIYGLTLERSIFQMELTGTEPGNVFNEPQVPTFRMELQNLRSDHWVLHSIKVVATADDGTVVQQVISNAFRSVSWSYGNAVVHQTVAVPVPKRGQYRLRLSILRYNEEILYRDTTFALLAPDTRKYRAESPFGTWDFAGGHATPNDPDLRGPLYVKAGLRFGMGDQPPAVQKKYGLENWVDPAITGTNDTQRILKELQDDPTRVPPPRLLVFHENGVSGPHLTRVPDVFTGRPPYRMSPDEKKTFQALWDQAKQAVPAIRAAFPKAEIYFGNATPMLLEEFLRQGWPCADLGTVGNESGSFMRLPETQPTDYIPGNAGIWMMREIANHYGCTKVPVRQCYEICYPGSGPGNLTEMTQAAYLVRHNLHSLAWGIPVIRPMTLTDMNNSYQFSNWGMAGLCHSWPNVSPKPAYVAYATLTQLLDGAKFVRAVPTGSTALYAFEFRKKDKTYVTCFWTVRGSRPVTLKVAGTRKATLTNLMGRESELAFNRGEAALEVSNLPGYVSTDKPVTAVTPGEPVVDLKPAGTNYVVSALARLADWTVETQPSRELEMYNFLNPRRPGNFEYREVPAPEAGQSMLEVKPKLPVPGSVYLQMYSVLALNKPVEIPGQPTEIALRVNGNGGWGRIIFELEDAAGQRWISLGAEQQGAPNQWMADWLKPEEFAKLNQKSMNVSDWNSDDAWGRGYINFDGWRLLKFPLPGQFPGDGYHWPMNGQWRWTGDGVVHYPLKFKKLVVTMPEKVLYGTDYVAPRRYDIQFRDLQVTYGPADKVFAAVE